MPKKIDDEVRSQRYNILLTPTLHQQITALAALTGSRNFNTYVVDLLKKHVEQNADVLLEYEKSREAILKKYNPN